MSVVFRLIKENDNAPIANVIRTVMPEFGAGGQGFAIHDREVEDMYTAYNKKHFAYFVCEVDNSVVGGGGVGPLLGGDDDTCELKKMYFLSEGRGQGFGQQLLEKCLNAARDMGYTWCYLETFNTMRKAMKLYERNGFQRIDGPMGNTGHFACDTFYRLKL